MGTFTLFDYCFDSNKYYVLAKPTSRLAETTALQAHTRFYCIILLRLCQKHHVNTIKLILLLLFVFIFAKVAGNLSVLRAISMDISENVNINESQYNRTLPTCVGKLEPKDFSLWINDVFKLWKIKKKNCVMQ